MRIILFDVIYRIIPKVGQQSSVNMNPHKLCGPLPFHGCNLFKKSWLRGTQRSLVPSSLASFSGHEVSQNSHCTTVSVHV